MSSLLKASIQPRWKGYATQRPWVWLASALRIGARPTGASWLQVYGVSLLCGVGFTMSLFIGGLAFDPNDTLAQTEVRMGVIVGSVVSTLVGMIVLSIAQRQRDQTGD